MAALINVIKKIYICHLFNLLDKPIPNPLVNIYVPYRSYDTDVTV